MDISLYQHMGLVLNSKWMFITNAGLKMDVYVCIPI